MNKNYSRGVSKDMLSNTTCEYSNIVNSNISSNCMNTITHADNLRDTVPNVIMELNKNEDLQLDSHIGSLDMTKTSQNDSSIMVTSSTPGFEEVNNYTTHKNENIINQFQTEYMNFVK